MPRKDKDEYNTYMKNYMANKKDKKMESKNSESVDIKQASSFLKDMVGEDVINSDPILRTMDKYAKYAPVALQFLQGFVSNIQERQGAQSTEPHMIAPDKPAGYGTLKALQHKDGPIWQSQVKAYDNYLATGELVPASPGVNINSTQGFNQSMSKTDQAKLQQENNRLKQQINQNSQPNNSNFGKISQMENKYPEPPLTGTPSAAAKTKEELDKEAVEKYRKENGDPVKQALGIEDKPKIVDIVEEVEDKKVVEYVEAELQQNIQEVVKFVNSQSDKDFGIMLKTPKKDVLSKVKMAKMFLSSNLKNAIKVTTPDEIITILKNGCPEKYKILESENKIGDYKVLFEEIKGVL